MTAGKEIQMSELAGKVAIVTGASKGIGAGIAKNLGAADGRHGEAPCWRLLAAVGEAGSLPSTLAHP